MEVSDLVIKVCIDDQCEAVWHNCPKKETHCKDCSGNIVLINEDTYKKKFKDNFIQYDFNTYELYRPSIKNYFTEIIVSE